MVATAGFTLIEINSAAVTVSRVLPLTEPEVAVMVVEPCPVLLASPALPVALLMVAIFVAEEFQVAEVVRSCVLPSVYEPVALNCCAVPKATEGFAGLTAIDTNVGASTLKSAALLTTDPEVAVITVEP